MGSFLCAPSSLAEQNRGILRPLGDIKALGRNWAIRAGKSVLQDIDQPTFEKIQTCEVLTLYWFSAGESQRNTMFSGNKIFTLTSQIYHRMLSHSTFRDCL